MNKTKLILNWLQQGRSISSLVAFEEFGTTRLSGVIFKLKQRGYNIRTEMVQAGTGLVTQFATPTTFLTKMRSYGRFMIGSTGAVISQFAPPAESCGKP